MTFQSSFFFVYFPQFYAGHSLFLSCSFTQAHIFFFLFLHISIILCIFAPNFADMSEDYFHWQEYGRAWRGIGIYHMTLVTPNREQLFGSLLVPDDDPTQASIQRTDFGNEVVNELLHIYTYYPEIRVLQFCLMPDHLHAILHVTRHMTVGITKVMRGYLQGIKRLEKEYHPHTIAEKEQRWERPFLRPLVRQGQLDSMFEYLRMNPVRLATKRLMPEFFRVQDNITIAGQTYAGVGNAELLQHSRYMPVHVRRTMVDEAIHGDDKRLRDYMNGCVLAARQGSVMVSPFISEYEKAVMDVLLKEGLSFIYIADNGFRDYYKPSAALFDAVARKQVLILSPWDYDPDKKHVSRADCVAMNKMAEDICSSL